MKRNLLLMAAGAGTLISDAGHSLVSLGERVSFLALDALPPEHPAELSNRELDEAMGGTNRVLRSFGTRTLRG